MKHNWGGGGGTKNKLRKDSKLKRKIFSILFALVLVLTLGLVTAAPVAAATNDLAVNDVNPLNGQSLFTFENIVPGGDPMAFDFKLHNVGTEPGVLTFSMSYVENDMAGAPAPDMSADEFASLIYVEAVSYQFKWPDDPEGPYVGGFHDDLDSWLGMDLNEDGKVSLYEMCQVGEIPYSDDDPIEPLQASAEITYFIKFQLGGSLGDWIAGGAILPAEDNRAQGDGISVTITATLVGTSGSEIEESEGNVFLAGGADSTVTMSASFMPVIGISVFPDVAYFGDVVPGVASGPETVTVTNTGTVAVSLSAEITEEFPLNVYTDGLTINAIEVYDWGVTTAVTVAEGANTGALPLVLTVPSDTDPGNYVATLIFWAEAQ